MSESVVLKSGNEVPRAEIVRVASALRELEQGPLMSAFFAAQSAMGMPSMHMKALQDRNILNQSGEMDSRTREIVTVIIQNEDVFGPLRILDPSELTM